MYCHSRNTCDEVGVQLQADGVVCRVYHAGLADKARSQALEDWASGRVPVIVGTIAFGMGIDRRDVRLVCHFNIPKSIENFYQESGRAGRDSKNSRSVLYYGLDDRRSMEFILRSAPKSNKKKAKDSDVMLKKGIQDFEEMVAYCDAAGCRRQKLLGHFGEQVSAAFCARTCDGCRHPSQVLDKLQELSEVASTRGPNKCHVFISSNEKGGRGFDSEFWNYSDEDANAAEEDISSSDNEANEIVGAVIRKQRHLKRHLDSKLDSLLEAEREYNSKQGQKSEKSKDSEKKLVSQSLRDVAIQKLTKAVDQALQRNQASSSGLKVMVEVLEMDCFRKYGKSGRSFYNSQVASTIRWLSSCSLSDLEARVPQKGSQTHEEPANKSTDVSEMSRSLSLESKARSIPLEATSEAEANTLINAQHKRLLDDAKEASCEAACASLPTIPSFSAFMNKKHKSKLGL